mmetsp:Transcript_45459/g.108495  ORF Transcript_45459/g.108495 Transcript_45459/m.108495 type:complete len:144 (+) Transcript_45459:354-785(+)|eukprot:CAMPEP_0180209368 /NCGR_PEP_ID=MMETSP0987-20121128/11400_1 /TAXON_ID=697907 /ORGANISM="non described non described, Strain CCMP2293" /LENGTH=143 /DNA_ID=CAMNT_0022165905 /DNA_START=351 /DNA_END=782 /DNA_ORIENTATION=+
MSNEWSTGLCSIWDDFETMLNATALCGGLLMCLPAKNNVDLNGGNAMCGLGGGPFTPLFKDCGCSDADIALAINFSIFMAFPPIAVMWRKQVRDTFSIDGSMRGDALACAFCFPCMVMQESREIKKRGTGFLKVPEQLYMTSR